MNEIKAFRCHLLEDFTVIHPVTIFADSEDAAATLLVEWYTAEFADDAPGQFTVEQITMAALPPLERSALREALLDQRSGIGVREVLHYHFVILNPDRAGRLAMEIFGSPLTDADPE